MIRAGLFKRRFKRAIRRLPIFRARTNDVNAVVRNSQLFDSQWYLDCHPDVAFAMVDPLDHYLTVGWKEGRNPNRLFDTNWYLTTYPDVRDAGDNPLLHYIYHGSVEPRDAGPNFRPSLASQPGLLRGAHHLAVAAKYVGGIADAAKGAFSSSQERPLRVLIIAELSIPQCRKYRVDQKQKLLRLLGCDSTVISWHDSQAFEVGLLMHSAVIFYRTPGVKSVLDCISQARLRGLPTFWEVDDLVFDPNEYIHNSNLASIDRELQKSVLTGVPLYRACMLACDSAIASTPPLADAMRKAGMREVSVVENALDDDTILAAEGAIASRKPAHDWITIGYGSGTKTHDKDFLEATFAIVSCMATYPHLRLRIIGELSLSKELMVFSDRIEFFPTVKYAAYLKLLAECDIAIAPLAKSVFNNAKSNIKYIEASMVELPSICSATAAFTDVVEHRVNGLLADNPDSWCHALIFLIESPARRRALAAAAKRTVVSRYSPINIATNQLAPIFRLPAAPQTRHDDERLHILLVNVFFNPQSFGGATIIAEQMANRLNTLSDTDVVVFTSAPPGIARGYDLIQYDLGSMPVFAVVMPEYQDQFALFEDPYVASRFREVVRLTRPNVVHIHCIQGLGADILEVCRDEGVPVVVTAHDAWWICNRQFMITGDGVYCFQRKVDLNVCATCVPDAGVNTYRQYRLRRALEMATLILLPSKFFYGIYLDNDFLADKLRINNNGVKAVEAPYHVRSNHIRLGFVGGNSPIKGAEVIKNALLSLERDDYECVFVDNALSLGYSSIYKSDWPMKGKLTILPSYTQDNMDDFYSRIDVLLFPTQWKESFGLTVREALIRNIWVITTDAGGVVEDVVHGVNGTVIPLLSGPDELAAAISDVLDRVDEIKSHENPYRSSITTYDDQAVELRRFLGHAAQSGGEKKVLA